MLQCGTRMNTRLASLAPTRSALFAIAMLSAACSTSMEPAGASGGGGKADGVEDVYHYSVGCECDDATCAPREELKLSQVFYQSDSTDAIHVREFFDWVDDVDGPYPSGQSDWAGVLVDEDSTTLSFADLTAFDNYHSKAGDPLLVPTPTGVGGALAGASVTVDRSLFVAGPSFEGAPEGGPSGTVTLELADGVVARYACVTTNRSR